MMANKSLIELHSDMTLNKYLAENNTYQFYRGDQGTQSLALEVKWTLVRQMV